MKLYVHTYCTITPEMFMYVGMYLIIHMESIKINTNTSTLWVYEFETWSQAVWSRPSFFQQCSLCNCDVVWVETGRLQHFAFLQLSHGKHESLLNKLTTGASDLSFGMWDENKPCCVSLELINPQKTGESQVLLMSSDFLYIRTIGYWGEGVNWTEFSFCSWKTRASDLSFGA